MAVQKATAAVIFASILLAVSIFPALDAQYNLGVAKSNYIKYGNFVGVGPGFEAFNDYDSLNLTVTVVAGKEVTLLSTGQLKNGTATPGNGTVSIWNVEAGTENGIPSTQGPIIAANLNQGDPIPPPDTFTVNATENRMYLGSSRTVNILNVAVFTPDYNSTVTYVYDRATGMLLEASSSTTTQADPQPVTSEYAYSVVETNIFSSNPTPTPGNQNLIQYIVILAIVLIIIVAVAVIVLFRKRI